MTSSYSATIDDRDGVEVYTLRAPDGSFAEIAPAFGCNCFAFSDRYGPVLEPVAFSDFRQKPTSYGIPILFPFPNRIRDGVFTFQGRKISLKAGRRHGYVRDKAWQVESHGTDV